MYDTAQPFEIAEDEEAEMEITELSPNVMRYRKGKEPKRMRCASYFDNDLLAPGSPAMPTNIGSRNWEEKSEGARVVLGEIDEMGYSGESGDADVSGEMSGDDSSGSSGEEDVEFSTGSEEL